VAIWPDTASSSFFFFFGGRSELFGPLNSSDTPLQLRQYDADASGGYATLTPANPDVLAQIQGIAGTVTTVCGGLSLLAGSHISQYTTYPYTLPAISLPLGLLTHSSSIRIWSNESTTPFATNNTWNAGELTCLPNYGTDGLVLFLGGDETHSDWTSNKTVAVSWLNFVNLTFYDPGAKKWYAQQTSGLSSSSREEFCAVAVQGQNSTEMYDTLTTSVTVFSCPLRRRPGSQTLLTRSIAASSTAALTRIARG
jgi:hypothetical protein